MEEGNVKLTGRDRSFGPTGSPCQLWLVDDNRELRHLMAELFHRVGGLEHPREIASGDALLRALELEVAPDVILLDIHLGERNGLDYLEPIKVLAPTTRVFMFTVFYDPACAARARQAGAAGFLLKSSPIEEIVTQILLRRGASRPNDWCRTMQA